MGKEGTISDGANAGGPTILVAEDDGGIRTVVTRALAQQGYRVQATGAAAQLWRWISAGQGDAAVIDVVLPDGNTLDLLPRIRQARPNLPVIVMSAQNTILTAVRTTERGAFDYLPKPFDLDNLLASVHRALHRAEEDELERYPDALAPGEQDLPIIGRSPAMQTIYRVIARLMSTDLTVLVHGESGTGKELVARALHDFGRRRSGPFVAVNMAAIPRELIESELFGHEKGAFTGANARKQGRFEQAEGGTLFLDEIGDMPLDAQTRLLRVLQQGEFMPVGGRYPIKTDLRIVAATHRDLRQMVAAGLFREDLYYRLNVVPLRLPPLRDRAEDVPALVQHFLQRAQAEGLPAKALTPEAMARLQDHAWPGNVRELENLVRRLAVLYAETTIAEAVIARELADLGAESPGVPVAAGVEPSFAQAVAARVEGFLAEPGPEGPADLHGRLIREVERELIGRVMAYAGGNQLKAAAVLGLNRNTLRKKIRELDVRPGR